MWTCPYCGEQHDDRFSECWKCAGADMHEPATATAPAAPAERQLRPFRAVLARAFIGFCIGAVLTMLFANVGSIQLINASWPELSLVGTSLLSLLVGLAFGFLVCVFVWVVFPYEPSKRPAENANDNSG